MANTEEIGLDDVRECLERSGYLLESRIVRALDGDGYFVEPNQVLRDPRTGKSREIDFVAEYYSYHPGRDRVAVNTYFIGEVYNNKFPFVLMTNRPSTPNEDFESHVKFVSAPELNRFTDTVDIYEKRAPSRKLLFSQYCVLSRKNSGNRELMATHPDDTYGSLQKLSEYAESEMDRFASWADEDSKYFRLFFWHPMLVLGGDLIAVTKDEEGKDSFASINSGFLEFNWHQDEIRKTTVIEVVKVDALLERMGSIVSIDADLHEQLHQFRSGLKD